MKPSTPKGTRDFLPQVVRRRNYIFNTIRHVFEKYGYQPIETPALENLETLTGKYGEEGDRLIFKILARGDKLSKALETGQAVALADEALRYDLTVPFARFVVQHQNAITFPFRRYQIQPVWRADRPQKGRYREFFQCDADVVGTDSLRCEVEFVQIFDEVYTKLGLPVEIRINNRKLLTALAIYVGEPERIIPLTIAIDKLDKLPLDVVLADLAEQGFSADSQARLKEVLQLAASGGESAALLLKIEEVLGEIPQGSAGIMELRTIMDQIDRLGLETAYLRFDPSLARGLNYYTGAIFEVVPRTAEQVGSISGGGRYDNLTGIFGMPGISGVGISFGADRIYDLLEARNAFPEDELSGTEILFVNFGDAEADYCHKILSQLRREGLRGELYPEPAKMKKQLKYADDKRIPFVALVGENEIQNNQITLRNMSTGQQDLVAVESLFQMLRNL